MKYSIFISFILFGCFESQSRNQETSRPSSNQSEIDSSTEKQKLDALEERKNSDASGVKEGARSLKPEIVGLRLARIPHRFTPGVYLHVFITETNNQIDIVKYNICPQGAECFEFDSSQTYDLIEDHYPSDGMPDGPFSIEARPCIQGSCGETQQIEGDFENQIDPITEKKLKDRRLIVSDLQNDLSMIRNILKEYLEDSAKCQLLNKEETKIIQSLKSMAELQLEIYDEDYLGLLIGNYPDKNSSLKSESIRKTVESMLSQESIFQEIVANATVKKQGAIGLSCNAEEPELSEEDDKKEEDEEASNEEDKDDTSTASEQEGSSPFAGLAKSIGGLLGQQFNPVEGFKRNFLNSISDLKDPLKGCTLSCPALISLRSRLGQTIPMFVSHLKSLLEIDEDLYGKPTTDDL